MLDELLGRNELKERIGELEDEVDRLEEQLAAERERRKRAVSDRQAVEERANRLEDRIADLEGTLERADDEGPALDFRGTERLRGGRLEAVLARLRGFDAGAEGALTAMVGDAMPPDVREAFGEHAALVDRAAPCLVLTDDAGVVSVALDPPVAPDPFVEHGERFRLDREWFRPSGEFGFALVRSDLFAYGAYDGDDRTDYEGFESDVKANHSKGGFSQSRFERRRDEQVDAHLDRCREVLEGRDTEALFVVGERTLLGEFDGADRTAAVDATGDPAEALDDAFDSFWTTTLYRI